ncbi:hypothetical protein CA606_09220 [Caulobacter vibrioides]|uniref:Uncharacterized protein n=1 Tax=Caulobacter vibrioides TaxID=155892 RepID=A0A290ML55_CAUVI|nr:hypothetical protein [Caulobacter vibrioides]ATC32514.1 hypothetical protein CA606_09220 [Caulobacter vibrioides]
MNEQQLNQRLDAIHARLQWIADKEARATWLGTYGKDGEYDAERTRLIEQTEKVLDALVAIGESPKYRPK